MKTILFILVLAFAAYYVYRTGGIKPEWFEWGSSKPTPAAGTGKADTLEKTLNRGLPRMVTPEVSLDRAVANNVQAVFNYRFVDLDQFAVSQRHGSTLPTDLKNTMIRDLCGNREVREQLLARGREVQLQVHAQDGRTVFSTALKPNGC